VEAWKKEIVKLSAVFGAYPQVLSSGVEMQTSQSTNYVVNSEGTALRLPEDLAYIRRGGARPGGGRHRRKRRSALSGLRGGCAAAEEELTRASKEIAEHVTALSQAPAGEAYDGPVLFEAPAAAELFGRLLGDNLKLTRKRLRIRGGLLRGFRASSKIALDRTSCRIGWT